MHEMSIAADLMFQMERAAAANQLSRILHVELHVGIQRLVVPEALEMAFKALAEGTLAEGASLEIVEIPVKATCNLCQLSFSPAIDNYLCPRCQEANVKIVEGDDIVLASMEGETEGERGEGRGEAEAP